MDNTWYNVTSALILSITGRGEMQIWVRVCNFEQVVIFTGLRVFYVPPRSISHLRWRFTSCLGIFFANCRIRLNCIIKEETRLLIEVLS